MVFLDHKDILDFMDIAISDVFGTTRLVLELPKIINLLK